MQNFKPVEPLVSPYCAPDVYPKAKTHPRILVTPSTLGRVRMNLTHPDHAAAYDAARIRTLTVERFGKEAVSRRLLEACEDALKGAAI